MSASVRDNKAYGLRLVISDEEPADEQVEAASGPDYTPPASEDDAMAENETELRIKVSEAETDTKFERVLSEMRVGFAQINGRFDTLVTRVAAIEQNVASIKPTILATVIPTGVAIAAVIIGALAYGGQLFGNGLNTRDVVRATVAEYTAQHPAQQVPPK